MKIKVSIIVPIYNTEKYLTRCIDSILKQDFSNFEIILVNDGSKDNSLNICNRYKRKYKNIIVINQKNSGPAIARNNGIKKANGKYVMFIDSDDFIDQGYITSYYNEIEKTKNNIVIGGYKKVVGIKVTNIIQLKPGEYSKYLVTGPVCRIINLNYIKRKNIWFLDTNSSEDIFFNLSIYNSTNKVSVIDNIGYNYFYNVNSLSNTIHKGFNQDVKIIEFLNNINFKKSINLEMNQYFIIKYCIWYLLYSGKTASQKAFMFEYNKLFTWLEDNITNYKNNIYISFFTPIEEPLNHRFIITTFILLSKLNLIQLFSKIYCKGSKK